MENLSPNTGLRIACWESNLRGPLGEPDNGGGDRVKWIDSLKTLGNGAEDAEKSVHENRFIENGPLGETTADKESCRRRQHGLTGETAV